MAVTCGSPGGGGVGQGTRLMVHDGNMAAWGRAMMAREGTTTRSWWRNRRQFGRCAAKGSGGGRLGRSEQEVLLSGGTINLVEIV